MNLNVKYVMCPICTCEAWILGDIWFRCFLCGAKFYGKPNLSGKPKCVNYNLRRLKEVGMFRMPDDEDYYKEPK